MSVDATSLFSEYFWPLYPPEAKADLGRARATDVNPANNPSIYGHLVEAARLFTRNAPVLFGHELDLDFTDASVHRLSAALTADRRDAWAAQGTPGTPENQLFNVIVHGAAYVGACIVGQHGGRWGARHPLWESVVHLKSHAGEGDLAVFHWWLKSFADDAFGPSGHTLADRYRTLVEVPCAQPEQWPVAFPGERRLPRLGKARYDVLYKYIKANLPELRDLGKDFPSAERLDELHFKWFDFLLLGGGRMVLMAGPSTKGVHLYWLDGSGFQKGVFFPADPFPEPIFKLEGDKLRVIVSVQEQVQVHEMLWWGP